MIATRFEWDPEKEKSNIAKHGINFEDAALLFSYSRTISVADEYIRNESRWQAIGLLNDVLLAVVIYLHWEEDSRGNTQEVIRIISARPAEKRERRLYEKNVRKF